MPAELHPKAEQELEEALAWLDDLSPARSLEFAVMVEDTLALLAARPGIGAAVRSPPEASGLRRHPVRRFNYLIIYEPIPGGIFVYAFAHQRREPGYWATRRLT